MKVRPIRGSDSGFSHVLLVVLVVVIGAVGFAAYRVMTSSKTSDRESNETAVSLDDEEPPTELIWQQREDGWQAMSTPPDCPAQPMMQMPADIEKVTSILYPGQTRGGNYKPHGGFRFDNTANADIDVTAPVGGFIVKGGHYLAEGEIQYTFDVMHNCGVMYRVGHLRELPENLKKLTTSWPAAVEGDSRTHSVSPAVYIKPETVLATSVGIISDKNTFFDWGVYDYRQTNEASKSASYQQAHAQEKELAWHAVCWFDWLPQADETRIRSLPAGDPTSGKNSDYCK